MPHPPNAPQSATEAAIVRLSALLEAEARLGAVDAQIAALDRQREKLADEVMVLRFRCRFGDGELFPPERAS